MLKLGKQMAGGVGGGGCRGTESSACHTAYPLPPHYLWSPERAGLKARCRAGDSKGGANNDKSGHEGLSSTDRPGAGPAPFSWDSPLWGGLEQHRARNLASAHDLVP